MRLIKSFQRVATADKSLDCVGLCLRYTSSKSPPEPMGFFFFFFFLNKLQKCPLDYLSSYTFGILRNIFPFLRALLLIIFLTLLYILRLSPIDVCEQHNLHSLNLLIYATLSITLIVMFDILSNKLLRVYTQHPCFHKLYILLTFLRNWQTLRFI